jgi:hypothetical protein
MTQLRGVHSIGSTPGTRPRARRKSRRTLPALTCVPTVEPDDPNTTSPQPTSNTSTTSPCKPPTKGADYISMRRLSELIGATTLNGFAALGRLLAQHRPDRYAPSIYRCR